MFYSYALLGKLYMKAPRWDEARDRVASSSSKKYSSDKHRFYVNNDTVTLFSFLTQWYYYRKLHYLICLLY